MEQFGVYYRIHKRPHINYLNKVQALFINTHNSPIHI